jgi:hypothetical protein
LLRYRVAHRSAAARPGLTQVLEALNEINRSFGIFLLSSVASAGDFGPWTFGMSQKEVLSQEAFGPYKSFSNGDLETYNGTFAGEKRNFQFYFKESSLWRIAIGTYEGHSIKDATAAWLVTYSALGEKFGAIETPDMSGESPEQLSLLATSLVASGKKAQMAPVHQPNDAFVFSTFGSYVHDGETYYTVTVNIDQPRP